MVIPGQQLDRTIQDTIAVLQSKDSPLPWFIPTDDPDHKQVVESSIKQARDLLTGNLELPQLVAAAFKATFADHAAKLLDEAMREIERLSKDKKAEVDLSPRPGRANESSQAPVKPKNFMEAMKPYIR